MQQIIDISIFVAALGSITFLLVLLYKVRLDSNKLQAKLTQAYIDNIILSERVTTLAAEKDANALKEDDGFIKFLSSSRDWAFTYIEEVQTVVQEFKDKAGPPVQRLSESDNADVKLITEAYNSLVDILPDELNEGK